MIENLIIQQDIDFFVGHFPFVDQMSATFKSSNKFRNKGRSSGP